MYADIDSSLILRVAVATKGCSGSSSMDADGWRNTRVLKCFRKYGENVRKSVAVMTQKHCDWITSDKSLETLSACRLIPLDKGPGVRPIWVGEVLSRIIGKVVMCLPKNHIMNFSSDIEMFVGQKLCNEAATHTMINFYKQEETEAVIFVDAANTFNNINRKVLFHDIKILYLFVSTYVLNCCSISSRLFIVGEKELRN